MSRLRIAVLGASGYTGADLVRLALTHPHVEIAALAANAKAGMTMAEVWPHFAPYPALPRLVKADDIDWATIDVAFGCLPHAASAALLSTLPERVRIVDLSADFRLSDAATYAQWYGGAHPAPQLLPSAVYGLTEFARDRLAAARLVACPGCYPTAALLALLPLAEAGLILPERITIFALSGVSGAGRSLKEANLFPEVAEAMHPYGLGGHRHMPEIEQELSARFGQSVTAAFIPHLIPINRGELETIAVELAPGRTLADLRAALQARYADEPFVHLAAEGTAPATRMVRGSNHVVLNVFADRIPGRALVVVAIDNLVKGSSGQAIQNMNLMFGLDETAGLTQAPLFPLMPALPFDGVMPTIDPSAWVAPGAQVIGNVSLGAGSSVWYNCVLRGDVEKIVVGARTNIQDGTVVHVTTRLSSTVIGDDCLIGHLAMVHGCLLEDRAFVGLGSIVMDGCVIEEGGMLAGAMLTPGKRIGRGQMWAGRPAKFVRDLTAEEQARHAAGVAHYVELARAHQASLAEASSRVID